jgi:hypothetical protein
MTRIDEPRTATLFTPESADRALLYVRAVVDDLVEASARLRRAKESRSAVEARAADEALERIGLELAAVGVEVKDPRIGLIDFPGEMEGRRVCLCWKKGEDRVAWWHELDAGFAGRRPILPQE